MQRNQPPPPHQPPPPGPQPSPGHRPVMLQAQHYNHGRQQQPWQQGGNPHSQPPPPGPYPSGPYPRPPAPRPPPGQFYPAPPLPQYPPGQYHHQPPYQYQYQYHQPPGVHVPYSHGGVPPAPHRQQGGADTARHRTDRPPPPPLHVAAHNGQHSVPQNYLSGNVFKNKNQKQNNRKRKKDIVQPVEPLTEEPVVRAPLNEAERREIEAWKAERRKHWPTEAIVEKKKKKGKTKTEDGGEEGGEEGGDGDGDGALGDTRSITLEDVLDTQQRLGLLRKAGTEELYRKRDGTAGKNKAGTGREGQQQQQQSKKQRGARQQNQTHLQNHSRTQNQRGHPRSSQGRKMTLLERLLEKDVKAYECKVVQLFHFVHMNGYFREPDAPLVFFEDDGEGGKGGIAIGELDIAVGEEDEGDGEGGGGATNDDDNE